MTTLPFRIETREDLAQAIATFSLSPDLRHRVPLLRAVYQGQIGLLEVGREGYAKKLKRFVSAVRLPAVVLLGDDDDTPSGPAGFPTAERAFKWARRVVVHATGGEPEHYAGIALAAGLIGRLVLVECTTANAEAWLEAAKRWGGRTSAIQVLTVHPGQPAHPVPVPRERQH